MPDGRAPVSHHIALESLEFLLVLFDVGFVLRLLTIAQAVTFFSTFPAEQLESLGSSSSGSSWT
jgi:hypothetical protein